MRKVNEEEAKMVIFSMNRYKALGPNVFPPTFFKELWDIVKYDIIYDAHDFVRIGKLLKELNQTFIVLIPKK